MGDREFFYHGWRFYFKIIGNFMKNLLIIGTGSFARIVHEYALLSKECGQEWRVKGYLKSSEMPVQECFDLPVIETVDNYSLSDDDVFICAEVDGNVRHLAEEKIDAKGGKFVNIIHPQSNISRTAVIGEGNIIGAFTTLSMNTKIGNHVIIQDHVNVGHDSVIEDYVHLYVGTIISGRNCIDKYAVLYTGGTVYPKIKIASNAIVGAGSVVMRNVKTSTTVLGNPAALLK